MPIERTTLVIPLASLDQLDEPFRKLRETKRLRLAGIPKYPWSGDVLLASYGPRGTGDIYVFAGILVDPELRSHELRFSEVRRFWHPVVVIYEKVGIRRQDLVGDAQSWGPSEHFYAAAGVAKFVAAEAETSLARGALEAFAPTLAG
jgi:hypothetical protein